MISGQPIEKHGHWHSDQRSHCAGNRRREPNAAAARNEDNDFSHKRNPYRRTQVSHELDFRVYRKAVVPRTKVEQ